MIRGYFSASKQHEQYSSYTQTKYKVKEQCIW